MNAIKAAVITRADRNVIPSRSVVKERDSINRIKERARATPSITPHPEVTNSFIELFAEQKIKRNELAANSPDNREYLKSDLLEKRLRIVIKKKHIRAEKTDETKKRSISCVVGRKERSTCSVSKAIRRKAGVEAPAKRFFMSIAFILTVLCDPSL